MAALSGALFAVLAVMPVASVAAVSVPVVAPLGTLCPGVRSGSWVGIGGVIKEFTINGALVPAIGRRVDLERKVGTSWRVIGTALPDSAGRLWFSMRQPLVSYYRWYVPATSNQTSAVSLSTRR